MSCLKAFSRCDTLLFRWRVDTLTQSLVGGSEKINTDQRLAIHQSLVHIHAHRNLHRNQIGRPRQSHDLIRVWVTKRLGKAVRSDPQPLSNGRTLLVRITGPSSKLCGLSDLCGYFSNQARQQTTKTLIAQSRVVLATEGTEGTET